MVVPAAGTDTGVGLEILDVDHLTAFRTFVPEAVTLIRFLAHLADELTLAAVSEPVEQRDNGSARFRPLKTQQVEPLLPPPQGSCQARPTRDRGDEGSEGKGLPRPKPTAQATRPLPPRHRDHGQGHRGSDACQHQARPHPWLRAWRHPVREPADPAIALPRALMDSNSSRARQPQRSDDAPEGLMPAETEQHQPPATPQRHRAVRAARCDRDRSAPGAAAGPPAAALPRAATLHGGRSPPPLSSNRQALSQSLRCRASTTG